MGRGSVPRCRKRVPRLSGRERFRAAVPRIGPAVLPSEVVLGDRAYARAKLAAGTLLREFARRHPATDGGDFHPGIIASDSGRYMGPVGAVLKNLARPFLDAPADGAARLIQLAAADRRLCASHKTRPTAPPLPVTPLTLPGHRRRPGADKAAAKSSRAAKLWALTTASQ